MLWYEVTENDVVLLDGFRCKWRVDEEAGSSERNEWTVFGVVAAWPILLDTYTHKMFVFLVIINSWFTWNVSGIIAIVFAN